AATVTNRRPIHQRNCQPKGAFVKDWLLPQYVHLSDEGVGGRRMARTSRSAAIQARRTGNKRIFSARPNRATTANSASVSLFHSTGLHHSEKQDALVA